MIQNSFRRIAINHENCLQLDLNTVFLSLNDRKMLGCVAFCIVCVCVVNPDHFYDLNSRRLTRLALRVTHKHTHLPLTVHSSRDPQEPVTI